MDAIAITSQAGKKTFAVAPMMDWTDRHCRFFHRQLTRHALLYTEMVVADAVINGPRERLLGYSPSEQPLALQIGGSDPAKMADAAKIGETFGFSEINMNVGCPSDRVRSGTFGACLMKQPALVSECVASMKQAVRIPVTVKCRIGVDEQDPETALQDMAHQVFSAGGDALWVHARKAWLKGLSPKENREIPPLNYDVVYRLKERMPNRFIGINGGISTMEAAEEHLRHMDGVMLGRAAYQDPVMLSAVDSRVLGRADAERELGAVVEVMVDYAASHVAAGGKLNQVTRHMLGLFHGRPGARIWRQMLSVEAARPEAGASLILTAFEAVERASAA